MPLPPWSDVEPMVRQLLLPTFAVALLVLLPLRCGAWLLTRWGRKHGERLVPMFAAVALGSAFVVGNHVKEIVPWELEYERPLTASDLREVVAWSLEAKRPAPEPAEDGDAVEQSPAVAVPESWYWLSWAAALAMVVDLLGRLPGVPSGAAWAARAMTAAFVGRLLTPEALRSEWPWAAWALSLVILAQWAVVWELCRRWRDGTVAASIALCSNAVSVLILFAHSARLTELGLLLFAGCAALALVAWMWESDLGAALAGCAVFLPALVVSTRQTTMSEVPLTAFVLAGLAPLMLAVLLLPWMNRRERWTRWALALGLPLVPLAIALAMAAQVEELPF